MKLKKLIENLINFLILTKMLQIKNINNKYWIKIKLL